MTSSSDKRYRSKKQENKVSKEISGKVTIASGALWGSKGDVRSDKFLVECKTTKNKEYRLSANTWGKIVYEAVNDGLRFPVMCIDIEDGKYRFAVFQSNLFQGIDSVPSPGLHVSPLGHSLLINSEFCSAYRLASYSFYPTTSNSKVYSVCVVPWETFLEWSDKLE